MKRKVFCCFFILINSIGSLAQPSKSQWVDSVFNTLNTNEKIGQLFMVPVSSHDEPSVIKEITDRVKSHQAGGIIFLKGSPLKQATLTNTFQAAADVPLLIGQDAEWGPGMSLDSTMSFPRALVLGAIHDDSLIYRFGKEVGRQLKTLGVNLNFAPLADLNSNPQDPLISYRSFGENKFKVANKAVAFMAGMQDQHVLACAKHFPVDGITVTDVQKGIPTIEASTDTIQSYPFLKLFQHNIAGVMPVSPEFPLFYQNASLIKKNNFHSSKLASLFTGDWMKKKLRYNGLTFVDIQQIETITDKKRTGEAETFAFQAGNDVLISTEEIGPAIRKIKKLIRSEDVYEEQLNNSVRKILAAKYDAALWQEQHVDTDNIVQRLNSDEARGLNRHLYASAITIIQNKKSLLPITSLDNRHFAYITSDAGKPNNEFYQYLSRYVNTSYFTLDEKTDLVEFSDALKHHEIIIVGIFPQTSEAVINRLKRVLRELGNEQEVIVCDFGHETFLKNADEFSTLLTSYVNTPEVLHIIPQIIFGGLKADGKLPISISADLPEGTGTETKAINRLIFTSPEEAGMSSITLAKIDDIVYESIQNKATPGCQVLVARNGKVVFEKSYGTLTYESTTPVTDETIYDLASLTKVSATLQAVMFMYEKGLIDLNKKASVYLPELRNTNKKDVTLIDMLTHQSGLTPFVPLWPLTVKDTVFLPLYYSKVQSAGYPLQIAPDLFAASILRDSVWNWISKTKMLDKPARTPYPYRYSDLGFMILQRIAEKILNQPLDDFMTQNFYEPLGASTTGFNPLTKFPKEIIAPTEQDKIYRRSAVVGTVHDERAAMMGGVSGHAGLFSNANDLAKLGQMLLQEGNYGGYSYFKPETVKLFTNKTFQTSRRGLGWDKPVQSDWKNSPTSVLASPKTFGHTGFTGTCMWIDPEFNLVYIFLSNRVYPDRNTKLLNTNVRSRIQDVIYQSIFDYCKGDRQQFSETPSTKVIAQ